MKIYSSALLVGAFAACSSPAPTRPDDPFLPVLIEAHQSLAEGSDAPLEDLRRSIRARCENVIEAGKPGYRARIPTGWSAAQGGLERSGRDFDCAVDGVGFFVVQKDDGSMGYTRCGRLELDPQGALTIGGRILVPQVTIPSNVTRVLVDTTGLFQGLDPTQPESLLQLGRLQLSRFTNAEKLLSDDGVLFSATTAAGDPVSGTPAEGGFGLLRQGFLEESNVDRIREVCALASETRQYRLAVEAWRVKQRMR